MNKSYQEESNSSSNNHLPFQPNTTQIPNVFFDYWMHVLTHAQFKVLMAIARKTFGWQKRRDAISRKQISEMTGLHRDSVRKCIQVLEEHQLLIKTEQPNSDGDHDPNLYEIRVVYEPDPGVGVSVAQGVGVSVAQGGRFSRPTKETKQNKSNKNNNPAKPESPSAVVVPSCLDKLQITDKLRKKISTQYTVREIEIATERALKWKSRESDEIGIMTTLRRPDDWHDNLSQAGQVILNLEYLNEIQYLDNKTFGVTKITVGNNYVEFITGNKVDRFETEDRDFIVQTKAMIKKIKVFNGKG